jgi:hypothetical protein
MPEIARKVGGVAGLVNMLEDEAAFGGMRHGKARKKKEGR